MELKEIILSEVSGKERDRSIMIPYLWNFKIHNEEATKGQRQYNRRTKLHNLIGVKRLKGRGTGVLGEMRVQW